MDKIKFLILILTTAATAAQLTNISRSYNAGAKLLNYERTTAKRRLQRQKAIKAFQIHKEEQSEEKQSSPKKSDFVWASEDVVNFKNDD